jgi:hypothetical protein
MVSATRTLDAQPWRPRLRAGVPIQWKGRIMSDEKSAFIPKDDRPDGYDLDTPVSSLRVRDLATILDRLNVGGKLHPKLEGHSPLKEFFDKPSPEVFAPVGRASAGSSDIDRLIQTVDGLAATVEQLAARVDELDQRNSR